MSNNQTLMLVRRVYDHWYLVIMLLFIFMYMLPYFVYGDNAFILIHDNIDSVFVTFEALSKSGMLFAASSEIVPQLNIPRLSFGSEFNFILLLFLLLPSFWAYVVNIAIIKITAFIGMYLLLEEIYSKKIEHKVITAGTAGCFSLLPFFPMAGLSVAGIPLCLFLLLKIYRGNDSIYHWFLLALLPLYSGLVYSYLFLLIMLYGIFFFELVFYQRFRYRYLAALVLLTAVFMFVEYRLVLNFINPIFIPHRLEFSIHGISLMDSLGRAWRNFIFGQYHVSTFHATVILPTILVSCVLCCGDSVRKYKVLLFTLIVFIAVVSCIYGFWKWEGLLILKENSSLLNSFNFSRFHWLHPVAWYISFAFALLIITKIYPKFKFIVIAIISIQLWIIGVANHEVLTQKKSHGISFRQLMAEDLFDDVASYIGKSKASYRVVSLGIHPAIAIHNGFNTADFYMNYYPLDYKQRFRRVIIKELEKEKKLLDYYDNWGSRVYIYSSELGKNFLSKNKDVYDLTLNKSALEDLGVEYILSSVKVHNDYKFVKKFDDSNSYWTIYLYKIEG